ncbi:hypothetical protein [Acinetobacter sp.]|uniref:hypothetical protein n=1 Tax=Acinetobacter sp. TaxID=472 RepID=UPI0025B964CD|nr:hypothetical protein [Acinetobacter sp.]
MSDQVSATLKTLLDTMQLLFQSLENEKQQHINLLKKLNSHVSNSQTEIKNDVLDFLNKIELQEFVSIVQDSKLNIENIQKSIVQLNAEIMQIKQAAKHSLAELEQQNLDISKKISGSSDKITSEIIKNVANDVKESVTQNFSLQFKEQNQTLILEAKKANSTVITNIIEIYNHLNKQVLSVTKDHRESLSQFKTDVSAFTESINIAINSVKDSFAEVEELNKDQMKQLYESSLNFRKHVLNKINAETENINSIFDDEINNISKNVQTHCNNVLKKMSKTEDLVDQKANLISLKLNDSLTTTEKIIVKQTNYYENLYKRLNFNYFAINTSSILAVFLVVLSALCITAFIQNKSLEKDNLALQSQNKKLNEDGVLLASIKNDSIKLTKQSISDVKKKFPTLIVTLNCKALD